MFSSRTLAALAVLATVAAIPTTERPIPQPITTIYNEDFESPWLSFPLFGNLFAPLWKLFPNFADIGPRISADDNKFEVVVNVKDYKKDDLKVKVKGDFIFIQGSHEAKQDERDIFASQFFHTYTLPVNSSSSDVTAQLTSDGNLIVTAPVISGTVTRSKDDEKERDVPIEETGKPYVREEKIDKPLVTTEPSVAVTEDEKRELTTPSDKENVTEKDNVIPHGNEVTP